MSVSLKAIRRRPAHRTDREVAGQRRAGAPQGRVEHALAHPGEEQRSDHEQHHDRHDDQHAAEGWRGCGAGCDRTTRGLSFPARPQNGWPMIRFHTVCGLPAGRCERFMPRSITHRSDRCHHHQAPWDRRLQLAQIDGVVMGPDLPGVDECRRAQLAVERDAQLGGGQCERLAAQRRAAFRPGDPARDAARPRSRARRRRRTACWAAGSSSCPAAWPSQGPAASRGSCPRAKRMVERQDALRWRRTCCPSRGWAATTVWSRAPSRPEWGRCGRRYDRSASSRATPAGIRC